MLIDRVDERDRRIGTIQRKLVFGQKVNFRVVHVFLFDRNERLLLQQLSNAHSRHPELWGSSAAGYLFAGESYEVAATRKVREELGVEVRLLPVGKTRMNDEGCTKFISLFRGTHDGPFALEPTQAQRVAFVSCDTLKHDLKTGRRPVTPTFRHLLSFYSNSQA